MKQNPKKIISLLLSLMLVFSSVLPLCANAQTGLEPSMEKNPFYEGRDVSFSSPESVAALEPSVKKTINSKTYYSNGAELYKIIRNNLAQRKTEFAVNYMAQTNITSTYRAMKAIEKLYVLSCDDAISESPIDGDYIRWAVSAYGFKTFNRDKFDGENYYYTATLQFEYYDSAAEEAEVDKVVNSFVASIDTNKLTDYEIIKKIHDFICSKTTYDYDAASDISGREYAATAYGALVKGLCVCQGYAVAFYRLCKELGYDARFVSSAHGMGNHAWNIVGLDGKYYFVDTTWDDGIIDMQAEQSPYSYFLVDYDTLRVRDSTLEEHTLDSTYYETAYYLENYGENTDNLSYDSGNKNLLSQSYISLGQSSFTYNGDEIKPSVTVFTNGRAEQYTITYSDNKNTGIASVNIVSKENERLLSHRNYYIIPKKMSSLSLADSGRETTAVKVKFTKAPGAVSGYKIEQYKNGKWSVVKTVSASATEAKITSLSPSVTYKFRIRSYKNFSKRNFFGDYSNVYIVATKPKTPSASSISTKSKSITFKWKKVACSGYQLQYSTDKSMKGAKTVNASSTAVSKKIAKLKKGKKYYFRVRAYKTYTKSSGEKCTCYSSWSAKKNIKCK